MVLFFATDEISHSVQLGYGNVVVVTQQIKRCGPQKLAFLPVVFWYGHNQLFFGQFILRNEFKASFKTDDNHCFPYRIHVIHWLIFDVHVEFGPRCVLLAVLVRSDRRVKIRRESRRTTELKQVDGEAGLLLDQVGSLGLFQLLGIS